MSNELTEAERDQLWRAVAITRDEAPRRPDDADTDHIIDAILDSGWLHDYDAARETALRAQIAKEIRAKYFQGGWGDEGFRALREAAETAEGDTRAEVPMFTEEQAASLGAPVGLTAFQPSPHWLEAKRGEGGTDE